MVGLTASIANSNYYYYYYYSRINFNDSTTEARRPNSQHSISIIKRDNGN